MKKGSVLVRVDEQVYGRLNTIRKELRKRGRPDTFDAAVRRLLGLRLKVDARRVRASAR